MAPKLAVSVLIPTNNRASYLDVALASLAAQALDEPYEVIVVDDGSTDATAQVAAARGARLLRHDSPRGLNAARNTGIAAASSDLVAMTDDDVEVDSGWLAALVAASRRYPDAEAFGGPIHARLEGPAPRGCGREAPPITTLDLGPEDTEAAVAWGANLTVRRQAWERIGPFREDVPVGGDEEEWLLELRRRGGRIVYVAGAEIVHRRDADDARLRALMRSAYGRGRNLRAWDVRRGRAPGLGRELRVLAGCGWHAARRGCPQGLIAGAHSLGRAVETLRPR